MQISEILRKKARLRNKVPSEKAQMDFSERKCSGDGLGTKNGSVISLEMVANSILNLSVFSICCFAPLDLFVFR